MVMEAIFVPASPDQSVSPYKQRFRNPRTNSNRALISSNSENRQRGGVLHVPPPSLSVSFPPSAVPSPLNHLHRHRSHQILPPLLPLPASIPYQNAAPPRGANKKINRSRSRSRSRSQSLTPKKSKRFVNPRKSVPKFASENSVFDEIIDRLGPDPNDLPKNVFRVLASLNHVSGAMEEGLEKFSGSVFTLSPPPSSLPLPNFSVKPKLSCKAEAAGFDAGATDNLCRLLRLR